MENLVLADSESLSVGDVKKGEKLARPNRIKLSDISNLQERPKPPIVETKKSITLNTNFVEKLRQDNAELAKHLADRNKLIELSVIELRKLRANLQKVKLQNTQLAQANSQMLMELNTGKDRLRVLQHDLGCANGLLKARKSEEILERRKRVLAAHKASNEVGSIHCEELGKSSQADNCDKPKDGKQRKQSSKQPLGSVPVKTVNDNEVVNKKRRCSRRFTDKLKAEESEATEDSFEVNESEFPVSSLYDSSLQASAVSFTEKETEGNIGNDVYDEIKEENPPKKIDKKRCLRRQSAKIKEAESIEDSFDIDNVKFNASSLQEHIVAASTRTTSELKVKEEDTENTSSRLDELKPRRSSVGRPLRQAAEKIQSYKERPLKTKLRRPE